MLNQYKLGAFTQYCWEFYAPNGLYGDTFERKLTIAELSAACTLRMLTAESFEGDSVDREAVREILIFCRQYATGAGFDGQVNLFRRLHAKT